MANCKMDSKMRALKMTMMKVMKMMKMKTWYRAIQMMKNLMKKSKKGKKEGEAVKEVQAIIWVRLRKMIMTRRKKIGQKEHIDSEHMCEKCCSFIMNLAQLVIVSY